jgi:hypothetical protein
MCSGANLGAQSGGSTERPGSSPPPHARSRARDPRSAQENTQGPTVRPTFFPGQRVAWPEFAAHRTPSWRKAVEEEESMLRLGLALGSTSVRAALLAQPRVLPHSTLLSAPTGLYFQCRTMAAKKQDAASSKKQRYSTKDTVKHKRVKSGLRHKRNSWLDSPRFKTISRKKKPLRHRLHKLNTSKRLAHYVKKLKEKQTEHPKRRLNETWYDFPPF